MTDGPSESAGAAAPSSLLSAGVEADRPASLWQDAWADLRRRPVFLASAFVIGLLIVVSVLPGLFDTHSPRACSLSDSHLPVSGEHWFGTDLQGCDVYSRTIHAARISVAVGVLTTLFVTLLGGAIGMLAGYYGGAVDSVASRFVDLFFAIPLLLGAFVILSVFTAGNVISIVFTLGILAWPQMARITRSSVITVRDMDYVQAARALGANDGRILRRHVLPNSLAPVIVVATINLGVYITVEATLAFLGIGLTDSISWGVMINDARERFLTEPGPLLFPAGFLFVTVLSFILLGDALRDALDPKLR